MKKYIIKRLLQLIPILFGITLLTFVLMHTSSVDAVDMMEQNTGMAWTEEQKAAAKSDDAVKIGLVQSLGVFIDTIVICTCTAMILLLVPQELTNGLVGMDLLQTAMQYHLGTFGTIFIAATLAMFSFSTFIGILFYARSNVAYLFGNKWCYQTAYKIVALVMLFIGGLAAYTTVWDLGDVGVGLMTIFNLMALYPMGGQALKALRDAGK